MVGRTAGIVLWSEPWHEATADQRRILTALLVCLAIPYCAGTRTRYRPLGRLTVTASLAPRPDPGGRLAPNSLLLLDLHDAIVGGAMRIHIDPQPVPTTNCLCSHGRSGRRHDGIAGGGSTGSVAGGSTGSGTGGARTLEG